jgi:hypothetical protein
MNFVATLYSMGHGNHNHYVYFMAKVRPRENSPLSHSLAETESMLGMLTRAHVGHTFVASNGLNALQ